MGTYLDSPRLGFTTGPRYVEFLREWKTTFEPIPTRPAEPTPAPIASALRYCFPAAKAAPGPTVDVTAAFYDSSRGLAATGLSTLTLLALLAYGLTLLREPISYVDGCSRNCLVNASATGLMWFAIAITGYYLLLFGLAARGRRRRSGEAASALASSVDPESTPIVVVVVPARNEEVVIERTVERVQALDGAPLLLVMDDGSDDDTAAVARRASDPDRTIIVTRDAAVAGRGKGDVLNAAVEIISELVAAEDPRLRGRLASEVVVCILDADGWLDPDAISQVVPMFAEPRVGGVQLSVRMWNARAGFLARMQDIEFVAYGHLFQSARDEIGSVLMGGNGQFMRLSALHELGSEPWTACLTEDLEIGLRLTQRGWRLRACPTACVSQQALVSPARFVRQRTRWVQGHLSCWSHLPALWRRRAALAPWARADLSLHLLLGSYGVLAALQAIVTMALLFGLASWHGALFGQSPAVAAAGFALLMLVPVVIVAHAYQRFAEARLPLRSLVGVMTVYTAYHYLWSVPATASALTRIALRRRGWAKTSRSHISAHDLAAHMLETRGSQ
jgi:cellulose synthase/poly-beta-1,6-N-acetylglucosamine synthase-like glycosyltransferase